MKMTPKQNLTTLEDLLRYHIHLPYKLNSGGWIPVLCKVCNDHGRKGPRAGFRFDSSGTVGYHCFNCGHKCRYTPGESKGFSENFKKLFNAFSIPASDYQTIILQDLVHDRPTSGSKTEKLSHEPPSISLPNYFDELTDNGGVVESEAIRYIVEDRLLDWKKYKWFISTSTLSIHKRWFGRLIIPIFKNNRLIYYSGRDITGLHSRKYINASSDRLNLLSNYNFVHSESPIYVVEGWFDAQLIDGVAIFGRELTPGQVYWLNISSRPKVVIPDQYGAGSIDLAQQAIKLGWGVSTPDIGDCTDITDAVIKYGKLYVLNSIKRNIYYGHAADIQSRIYCK